MPAVGFRRLLIWIAIALVALDLAFFSGASNFLASPQSRILDQVLILLSIAAFGIVAWQGALDVRSPLVLPGLAWIVANVIATILSARPANSIEGLALLLLAAPAYLVVRGVVWTDWLRPRIDLLVIASALTFAIAYLAQAFTQWLSWWSVAGPSVPPLRPGDVGLTVGTVNAVSLYLELLSPIAIWLSWTRWRRSWFTATLAAVSLVALVVTGSRGAWLGVALGGALLAVLVWQDQGRPLPRPPRSPGSRAAAVTAGGVALLALIALAPVLLARLAGGDAGRFELWTAAWGMFIASPLGGAGPGAFPDVRPQWPISEPNLAILTTSHNSVLQVLAEVGIVGAIAAAWLLVTLARMTIRAIRAAPGRDERILRQVCTATIAAVLVHSLVDTQFHLPAILILTFHVIARLDPPPTQPRPDRPRLAIAATGATVVLGAVLLIPIDVAMVQAAAGNEALAKDDAVAARDLFASAASVHELGPYRLGEALADARLGDLDGTRAALDRLAALQPLSFVTASQAVAATAPSQREVLLTHLRALGPYDATASANAAVLRYPDDRLGALQDLTDAMLGAPTLIYSERPATLFDDDLWGQAQRDAIEALGAESPVYATVAATLSGRDDLAGWYKSAVAVGSPEARALDLLAKAVRQSPGDPTATASTRDAALALLREAPESALVQWVIWSMGFATVDQPLIDAVVALSIPAFFGTPLPPMELVVDGRPDADYSLRLPRYPMSANGRNGPDRPYLAGMVTIEPVFRPGR